MLTSVGIPTQSPQAIRDSPRVVLAQLPAAGREGAFCVRKRQFWVKLMGAESSENAYRQKRGRILTFQSNVLICGRGSRKFENGSKRSANNEQHTSQWAGIAVSDRHPPPKTMTTVLSSNPFDFSESTSLPML